MSEPDEADDECEIECPYCDGDGWNVVDVTGDGQCIRVECPECGGDGRY